MIKNQAAPGRLDLVRAFINTWDEETGRDGLSSPREARAWFETQGFHATFPALPGYEELRTFREALRPTLEAHAHAADSAQAWERIRSYAEVAELRLDVEGPDRVRLAGAGNGVAGFIAEVLAIVYEAIRDGTWVRLKLCTEPTCAVAYYDHSKNGSGVWCSMAVCGNRNKARRRRKRVSAGGA